jgi:hypothetical protein
VTSVSKDGERITDDWDVALYWAATKGGDPDAYFVPRRIEDLARLLGGEWDGNTIVCPSPRQSPDDRSCIVRINTVTGQPYIYYCNGPKPAAYKMVRAALGLTAPRSANPEIANRIWGETSPASGTLVEVYLRSRALTLPLPASVRFHPRLKHKENGGWWPAMVAERQNVNGQRTGVHRTFLCRDGSGKALVDPQRKDIGRNDGGAIRLAAIAPEIAVGEGIETTLSVMQWTGLPGWATGSADAMRSLLLPPEIRSVIICADGDEPGEAAARAAAARWKGEGRSVRIARAPARKDFNDLLKEAVQ